MDRLLSVFQQLNQHKIIKYHKTCNSLYMQLSFHSVFLSLFIYNTRCMALVFIKPKKLSFVFIALYCISLIIKKKVYNISFVNCRATEHETKTRRGQEPWSNHSPSTANKQHWLVWWVSKIYFLNYLSKIYACQQNVTRNLTVFTGYISTASGVSIHK